MKWREVKNNATGFTGMGLMLQFNPFGVSPGLLTYY